MQLRGDHAESLLFSNCSLCLLGSRVHVSKVSWLGNATEHGEVDISCSLHGSGSPASLYSVTWYWSRENAGRQMLVHLHYDGLLEYGQEGRRTLLHCYRSSPTDFILKLHRVQLEDAGMYWCRVAEWQQHGHPGKWINQASDESQRMMLTVLPSGNLGVNQPLAHGVTGISGFPLCFLLALFSPLSKASDNFSDFSKKVTLLPFSIVTQFNPQGYMRVGHRHLTNGHI